jgi:hypothetical protein
MAVGRPLPLLQTHVAADALMITLPRKVTTWVQGTDFGRQVFQFASDVFDALRALRKEQAIQDANIAALQVEIEAAGGGVPDAHAASHLPASGSDPLTVGTTADSFAVGNDFRLGSSDSFAFTAGAVSLNVSTSLDFAASDPLTEDSAITLTNGTDGRRGRIYVIQDSTGGWDLTFAAAGRTLLLEEGAIDTSPGGGAGAITVYDYDFQTIDGTDYLVIRRTLLDGGAFLLDGITVAALIALSAWRKLRQDYDGPAIRVRRSTDDVERDIYFNTLGVLDTVALLAFAGSASLFVTVIYDQSGNSRDYSSAIAAQQPRIVNAGALETMGSGQAAFVCDGTDDFLGRTDSAGLVGTGATTGGVTASFSTASRAVWGFGGNAAGNRWSLFYDGASIFNEHTGSGTSHTPATAVTADNYYVHGYPAGGDTHSGYMRQNGSVLAGGTAGAAAAISITASGARLGDIPTGGFSMNATMNMAVLFNSVLAGSDLTELEAELARHVA